MLLLKTGKLEKARLSAQQVLGYYLGEKRADRCGLLEKDFPCFKFLLFLSAWGLGLGNSSSKHPILLTCYTGLAKVIFFFGNLFSFQALSHHFTDLIHPEFKIRGEGRGKTPCSVEQLIGCLQDRNILFSNFDLKHLTVKQFSFWIRLYLLPTICSLPWPILFVDKSRISISGLQNYTVDQEGREGYNSWSFIWFFFPNSDLVGKQVTKKLI